MIDTAGVDYLTVTAKHHTVEAATIGAVFDGLKYGDSTSGVDEKPARSLGYTGSKVGTMFHGVNADGAMLRISGPLADVAARMLTWLPGTHHVTRIDYQITWRYGHDMDEWFTELPDAIRASKAEPSETTKAQIRHIRSFGKGDTVSIGARSSEVFVRVYDKSREQVTDPSEGLVRYEVELKGERARQSVERLTRSAHYEAAVVDTLSYWLERRGVPFPWGYENSYPWPEIPRPETDAERKLRWLGNHVRSTVVYLIHKGYRQQALETLGFDETTE